MNEKPISAKQRIIFPIDTDSIKEAIELLGRIQHSGLGLIKIGLELMSTLVASTPFYSEIGSHLHEDWARRIMWDAKLHDIPNTVGKASARVPKEARFVTAHATGGVQALKAIVEHTEKNNIGVLAVTVLTSIGEEECRKIYGRDPKLVVAELATIARDAGVAGIVCSPQEIEVVRNTVGDRMLIVTPGVRPKFTHGTSDDQQRVMTPAEAIKASANYLVIGRPISRARDYGLTMEEAIESIATEIATAL